MIQFLLWLAAALLFVPALDAKLDEVMADHLVYQMGPLALLGVVSGALGLGRLGGHEVLNRYGAAGLIFFLGTLSFWMIPRSVDLAALNHGADMLMQGNLFVGGLFLGASLPRMPFVLKSAAGIYGLAMLFSLAQAYQSYETLLCAAYDLEMQREAGERLMVVFPFLFVLFLALSAKNLVRYAREGAGGGKAV